MIFTSYLTYAEDPQRHRFLPVDDYDYIRPWYESMRRLGLPGTIFHNELSEEFVGDCTTEDIRFVRVDPGPYCAADYRWIVYLDRFEALAGDSGFVLFTDCQDVTIVRDPFEFITDSGSLYVGVEDGAGLPTRELRDNIWMQTVFGACGDSTVGNGYAPLEERPVLNCGIAGGSVATAKEFLGHMARLIQEIDPTPEHFDRLRAEIRTIDMAVLNYVCWTLFPGRVVSGKPLHNAYKRKDKDPDVYIWHK